MKNRKSTAFLLALIMLLTIALAACGGKDAADDPNLGVWNATTGEALGIRADISDFFGSGFVIELKSGGKCTLNVDGDKANGKWTLENGAFTVSGGGFDGSGRLENGTLVLEDVMGMGLTITFEKEGGSSADAVQKPGADGPVGVWIGKTVTLPGEEPSDSFMGMMAVSECIYLELKGDGSVRLQYIGEIVDTTWEENGSKAGTIDFDGMPVDFELKGGEMLLYFGEKGGAESLEYALESSSTSFEELAGDGATVSEEVDAVESEGEGGSLSDYDYHPEHVSTFEGDWFGVIYFESGFGEWEGIDGFGMNVVARFAFRNGECEAFFSTEVEPGEEYLDFQDIVARIGTNGLAISGTLLGLEFENTLVQEFEGESAMMYIDTDDYDDGYNAVLYLRPWGEEWSYTDPWTPTDENVEFVANSTFEEIVEILGGDIGKIPASTNIAGKNDNNGGAGGEKASGDIGSGKNSADSGDSSDAAISQYGLDPESDDWQDMSADCLSEEELLAKYEIISNTPWYTMNYEEVVDLIGVEPSRFRFDGKKRIFEWQTEENSARYIRVVFALEGGEWLYESFSKTNM